MPPTAMPVPPMPSWMVARDAAEGVGLSTGRMPAASGGVWSLNEFANTSALAIAANSCSHCSNITVKCIPDAEAAAMCGGVLACASDCGMFIGLSTCDASRIQSGNVSPSEFDQATNCVSTYANNHTVDSMMSCCALRHEKYHACNPTPKGQPFQCGEAPADSQGLNCETNVVVANCRVGSRDPNCYGMCYQLASYVMTQGYDSCMCGVASAAAGHPSHDQCCSCQTACTTAGLAGKLPPICKQWLSGWNDNLWNNCRNLATTGSHNCNFYGGPTIPSGSCHAVVPCVSPGVPDPLHPGMCKCPVGIDVSPGQICPSCKAPAVPDLAMAGLCKCPAGPDVAPGWDCQAPCLDGSTADPVISGLCHCPNGLGTSPGQHCPVNCVPGSVPDPASPTQCKCPVGVDVSPGQACPTCAPPSVFNPQKPGGCTCPNGSTVYPGVACPTCLPPSVQDPSNASQCKCPSGQSVQIGQACPSCVAPAQIDPSHPGNCKCPDGALVAAGQTCPVACSPSSATRIPGNGYIGSCGQQQCNPTSCVLHTRAGTQYSQLGNCPDSASQPNCVN